MSEIRLLMEKWDTYLREIETVPTVDKVETVSSATDSPQTTRPEVDLRAIQAAMANINTNDEFKRAIEMVLGHSHPEINRERVFSELMGPVVGSQLEDATNPATDTSKK